ncbi:hypothetical protein [Actinomyces lilanjuaniae]|uniref:hypothetical protein n=1 Tax=Actinomyces lilanjuaniae TaxID=2321394 RepID=UPI0013C419B7|nr:hypothetical protein [Actinomyces lilanjuaniae]
MTATSSVSGHGADPSQRPSNPYGRDGFVRNGDLFTVTSVGEDGSLEVVAPTAPWSSWTRATWPTTSSSATLPPSTAARA